MNVRGARQHKGQTGLTLIETLLALTVLGIALVVLVASAGQALGVVRRARHFETARHLMEILQLEHPVTNVEEVAGTVEVGGFDPPYETYTWERSVEPWLDMFGEETGYYVVRTKIRGSDPNPPPLEEFVTGIFPATRMTGTVARVDEAEVTNEGAVSGGGLRAAAPRGGSRGQPRGGLDERVRQGRGASPDGWPAAPAPGARGARGLWERLGRVLSPNSRDRELPRRVTPARGEGRPRTGRAYTFPDGRGMPAIPNQPLVAPTPRMPPGQRYDGPPLPPGF